MAKIDVPQTYEQGRPKLNGLSDPRLGTMDRAVKCTTDGATQQDSPGYFGHIELAKPVYHIGFIHTVVKVLRCVSYHSSKLLVDRVNRDPAKSCFLWSSFGVQNLSFLECFSSWSCDIRLLKCK